jgi:predicted dehydrogenase
MKKIGVGVIGAGFIGPAHVEALRRLPNVEVTALAGSDEPSAKAKARALGVPRAFGDYHELIALPDIAAVHVCTPNHLHFEISRLALNEGKHVVCEKPLAVSSSQARELAELAEKKGLANAVHYNLRYYPLVRQLKLMVQKGELGGIFAVHGSYLQDWLLYSTDYNWRLEPELSGSSRAVADIGTHWMDMVEFVSGLRISEVLADFATFHKTRKKPLKPVETFAGKMLSPGDYAEVPISTEDFATVLLRFDSGARGSFTVSQVSAGRKNRLFLEMDGSKAAAAWDQAGPAQ